MTKVDKVGSKVPDLLHYDNDNCFEGVRTHKEPLPDLLGPHYCRVLCLNCGYRYRNTCITQINSGSIQD